jgi:hypothetical protein
MKFHWTLGSALSAAAQSIAALCLILVLGGLTVGLIVAALGLIGLAAFVWFAPIPRPVASGVGLAVVDNRSAGSQMAAVFWVMAASTLVLFLVAISAFHLLRIL